MDVPEARFVTIIPPVPVFTVQVMFNIFVVFLITVPAFHSPETGS
jgi:hypothetical protein